MLVMLSGSAAEFDGNSNCTPFRVNPKKIASDFERQLSERPQVNDDQLVAPQNHSKIECIAAVSGSTALRQAISTDK